MIKIDKRTRDFLTRVANVNYGENGISRTYSHNRSYYLCESRQNKELLKKYYEQIGLDPKDIK